MDFKFSDITPIILALITTAGAIILKVIEKKREAKENKQEPPPIRKPSKTAKKLSFFFKLLIFISIATVVYFVLRLSSSRAVEIKITDPKPNGSVERREVVKGTSRNMPEEHAIWIVVFSQSVNRYYPQNDPADLQTNGDWASACYFGNEQDVGRKFDIIAVQANKQTIDSFNAYLSNARNISDYAGLGKIPQFAKLHDRITVVRK